MSEPKYPDIEVELLGSNGNALAIISKVSRALRDAGVDNTERDAFYTEATSGDYDHLLQTCMQWVEVS